MENLSQNKELMGLRLYNTIKSFCRRAEKLLAVEVEGPIEEEKNERNRRWKEAQDRVDRQYQAACSAPQKDADDTLRQAGDVLKEMAAWDEKLVKVNSEFRRLKYRDSCHSISIPIHQEMLGRCSREGFPSYQMAFQQLESLYKELGETVLNMSVPHLRFAFCQRCFPKALPDDNQMLQNYKLLIGFRNTAEALAGQLEQEAPRMVEEKLAPVKARYAAQNKATEEQRRMKLRALEEKRNSLFQAALDTLRAELDELIPDRQLDLLLELQNRYAQNLYKVNTGGSLPDGVLYRYYISGPVASLSSVGAIQRILAEKSMFLGNDGQVALPVLLGSRNLPKWKISAAGNESSWQNFIQSFLFGLLSTCPAGSLTYTIVDPEKRGGSIPPSIADLQKKLPKLFGEGIVAGDGIAARLHKLSGKIEEIMRNRLGSRYETIFDYAQDNPDYVPEVEAVILYDFPLGFDQEDTLREFSEILLNGWRCGICVIMVVSPDALEKAAPAFRKKIDSVIRYGCSNVDVPEGMLASADPLDETKFAAFIQDYTLAYEAARDEGVSVSPAVRPLTKIRDSGELDAAIRQIQGMVEDYRRRYAKAPEISMAFPSQIPLGIAMYPAALFAESPGFRRIQEGLGVHGPEDPTGGASYIGLPWTVDLGGAFNLLLTWGGEEMLAFTRHVIWNFLSFLPVTKVNVCVFDSERRGNSVKPFLDFKRSTDAFEICTDEEEITLRLKKINDHITDFIQEKLSKYGNFLEYNQNSLSRTEPVTLLVLYDFPSGMDGRSLKLLTQILRSGNQCGVYTVICHNPSVPFPEYEKIDERLEEMAKYCLSVDRKDGGYSLPPYHLELQTPENPSAGEAEAFVKDYLAKRERIKARGIPFEEILPPELFSQDSSRGLSIPIGKGDGDSVVRLVIGEGSSHHALIAGATGSGKSSLFHTLIMSAMLHYSPDQLHLYLMDFKNGTEFKIYESARPPHIKLLALDAMQEFGESILENLVEEMEQRSVRFKEAGQADLGGYRAAGGAMPRILVIMDEFQILFNSDSNRKVALHCAELTKRIVTEGRSYGIHLLMATQSTKVISDLTLSPGTIDQMLIRIGLKCGESDARYLFADHYEKAMDMMKGPTGTAVMSPDYTEGRSTGFRVAYCDKSTQRDYLDSIRRSFAETPDELQIFEGGRTANLLDYFEKNRTGVTDELPVRIHLGELIKVAPPLVISVDRKRNHNLLVCGTNERMTSIITENYILSALLNRNAKLYYIDGDILVGDDSPLPFCEAVGQWSGRFWMAQDRGSIFRLINEVYESYQARKKQNSREAIFVLIKHLQFLDVVRSMLKQEPLDETDFFPEEEPEFDPTDPFAAVNSMFTGKSGGQELSTGDKLIKMIKDGSSYGIHFAITSLEYPTVQECLMQFGGNILAKFPERIIFSLDPSGAAGLIADVSVEALKENTVYYTDGVKNKFQVKPFVPPEPEELRRFLSPLKEGC